jgi:predicted nucleotidyltransferase
MQSIDTRYTLDMEGSARTLEDTLWELETGLRELYGARYQGLVLYGSYARGDADAGSDIDLLLLLAGLVESGTEIRRASELVSRLSLDSNRVLSVIPVDTHDYQTSREPYLENVRWEGRLLSAVPG